ncbi:helix-turn-helix domain-containing protein [Enterococcus gallinarum]|nr:helix-turn-helix domain-containing protein [Enterococcus gallinarum]MCW3745559.1 helix-turn-helix domain-containing protein [Enterococcus gallinarum]
MTIFFQHGSEISYKTLANKLSISSPTLQKEIQHLSDNLSVFHAEALLETKENDRLHLTLPLDFSIQHFFMRIYQKQWIFKLLNISFSIAKDRQRNSCWI